MTTVAKLWSLAEAAWRAQDASAALAACDDILRQMPDDVRALGLAGELRTAQDGDGWERGLGELERAVRLGTGDVRTVLHYVGALKRRQRTLEAVPAVQAWLEGHADSAAGWNSLGWLLGVEGNDLEGGLQALRRATKLQPDYGDARLNLGRIYLKRRQAAKAVHALHRAVQSGNCRRAHEAWLRLGEAHVMLGQLRRALGAFRRAQETDLGEYTQPLFDGVNALTHVLHQHQRYFLHALDESRHGKALEASLPAVAPGESLTPLASLAERARALRPLVRERDREKVLTALDAIEEQASAHALLPKWADQTQGKPLDEAGSEAAAALAHDWRVAQASLYEELLEREESLVDASAALSDAQAAAAERRWDEAEAALKAEQSSSPGLVATLAERWGDRLTRLDAAARARAFYLLASEALAQVKPQGDVEAQTRVAARLGAS